MATKKIGGTIYLKVDGLQYAAKGNFTYNLGYPKREAVAGVDRVHGYKETQQPSFIEGEITDNVSVDLKKLVTLENATVTLDLANGKSIVLRNSWYAGEGTGNTEEGNVQFRVESADPGEELQ